MDSDCKNHHFTNICLSPCFQFGGYVTNSSIIASWQFSEYPLEENSHHQRTMISIYPSPSQSILLSFILKKKTYRHISSLKMISYFSSETVTVSPTVSGSLPPSTRTVKSCNEGCVLVIFLLFRSTKVIEKCFIEGYGSKGEFHETIMVGSTDTLGSHSTWNRKLRVHIQLKSQN